MEFNMVTDKIKFAGKILMLEEFAERFYRGDLDTALEQLALLVEQGRASIIYPAKDKGVEQIEKANTQQEFYDKVEEVYNDEDRERAFKLAQKREGRLTYKAVDFAFPTQTKAKAFKQNVDALNLESQMFLNEDDTITLQVKNITDADLNKLQLLYKTEKAVQNTLKAVESGASKATEVVDYTANKVVVPVVAVGAKAGVGVLKTLTKTTAKTASTLLTSLSHGVKQTTKELKNDADLLKAKKELLSVKDSVMQTVATHKSVTGKGITVHQD